MWDKEISFMVGIRSFRLFHGDWTLEAAQERLDELELLIAEPYHRQLHDLAICDFVKTFTLELEDIGYIDFTEVL